jgi:drug/metabolite transporter (DMT)-like permease
LVASFLKSQAAAYVLLPIAAMCWAGNHVVARAIAGHVPPGGLAVVRWTLVLSIVSLFAFRHIRRDWPKLKAKAGVMLFLSLTGGGAFGTLQFVALQYTTAINMGVVGSVAPAFIVAASFILFGDRMGFTQLTGVGISLTGVLAIVTQLHPENLFQLTFNTGDLIIITNMVLWAIYCACLRLRPDVHPLSFLFALSIVALIGNVPFALWEHASGYHLVADTKTGLAIFYAAVFTTLLAYITWNRGIDLIGAPRAGAFLHTIPLFSTTLAMLFLGEQLKLFHVVGFALILSGVSLAARPSAPARIARGPQLSDSGAS